MTELMDNPARAGPQNGGEGNVPARIRQSALGAMASRYQIDAARLKAVLMATVIRRTDRHTPTEEEVAAFILVANQYDLNPLLREIHAFADKEKGVVPIVSIDGWAKIVNSRHNFDGCEFAEEEGPDGKPLKTTCTMYAKDRQHAVSVTERFAECKRNTGPWTMMPFRMLRHKSFMQCARVAFSISGIYDEDEARDIVNNRAAELDKADAADANKRLENLPTRHPVDENKLLDHATSQVPPDETPEPPAEEPAEAPETDAADLTTWETTVALIEQLAQDSHVSPSAFDSGINKWALSKGKKGKLDKTTPQERTALVAAIRAGRFDWERGSIREE